MPEFLTPTDIGSRAAQYCGQTRLDPVLGFADPSSKASSEIGFVYDKLRRAELQQNTWRFAIRVAPLRPIDGNTVLLAPTLWVQSTTYFKGSLVSDASGMIWESTIPNNLANFPAAGQVWVPYFGPLTVSLYDTTGGTAYFAGDLVYTAPGDGTYRVYKSLISDNTDVPGTGTPYSSTTTFYKNQVTTFNSVAYMSLIDLNTNNEPDLSPASWASGTTYAATNKVCGSDGVIYSSVGNGNLGHDPTLDATHTFWTNTGVLCPWTTVFVGGVGSLNWLQLGGLEFPMGVTLKTLDIQYPIGSGPLSQSTTRNVFRLPSNFLRKAPKDPKAGIYSPLGAPGNLAADDWEFRGDYLISWTGTPIMFPFVADVMDVTDFDAMFAEGLAARCAVAVEEPLTNSTSKSQFIQGEYQRFMNMAKQSNAIVIGSEEPPLDDWIACRL